MNFGQFVNGLTSVFGLGGDSQPITILPGQLPTGGGTGTAGTTTTGGTASPPTTPVASVCPGESLTQHVAIELFGGALILLGILGVMFASKTGQTVLEVGAKAAA